MSGFFKTVIASSDPSKAGYEVTYMENRPDWQCHCKAFQFGGGKECKHIAEAKLEKEAEDGTSPDAA